MSYSDEYQTVLQRIDASNPGVRGLRYFLSTAAQWHAIFQEGTAIAECPGASTPLVVVLGHGIPEQLIYACNTVPLHLLGGSHASCAWSDDAVPRDSDPQSRSMLGYALRLVERRDIKPLFVVPFANDNMRKIAYFLMREGHAVHAADIPPRVASAAAQQSWERAVMSMVQAVERHVGSRVNARSVRSADQLVSAARTTMVEFERTCADREGALDAEARLLVLGSYYQTRNLAQWTEALRALVDEVKARHRSMGRPTSSAPRILVVGSPMLFPQYKVPALVGDVGLRLLAAVDSTSTTRFACLTAKERYGGTQSLMRTIARRHYELDSSGAHVINQSMEQYVEYLLRLMKVDGIVFHILKGQIEHDFTYARMESVLERYDVPVFRLETDYQYQDIEQLRIRLEAFAELLSQRTLVTSRSGVRRSA